MVPVIYTDHVPAAFSAINKLVVVTATRAVENVTTTISVNATSPFQTAPTMVFGVVAYIFLNYTKIGTYTYAIGSDEFVAKNMGINVNINGFISYAPYFTIFILPSESI